MAIYAIHCMFFWNAKMYENERKKKNCCYCFWCMENTTDDIFNWKKSFNAKSGVFQVIERLTTTHTNWCGPILVRGIRTLLDVLDIKTGDVENKINFLEKKKILLEKKKYKKNKIFEKYLQHIGWCLKRNFIKKAADWCQKGKESLKKTNDIGVLVKIVTEMEQFRIDYNNKNKKKNDDNNAEI